MDASFLNFHQEETFQAFHSSSYYLDDIYGDLRDHHHYEWESERELHSDVGATPTSEATGGLSERSNSPQHHEIDNMLLLEKWTQHISSLEIPNVSDLSEVCGPIQTAEEAQDVLSNNVFCDKLLDKDVVTSLDLSGNFENVDPIGHLADTDFDITKYVNEPDINTDIKNKIDENAINPTENVLLQQQQPGGKKIDMKNARYIVEDDENDDGNDSEEDVDVETLSECDDNDLINLEKKKIDKEIATDLIDDEKLIDENNLDFKTTEVTSFDLDPRILQAGDLVSLLEEFEANEVKNNNERKIKNDKKSDVDFKQNDSKIQSLNGKSIKEIKDEKKVKIKDKEINIKHIKVKNKVLNNSNNVNKSVGKIDEKILCKKDVKQDFKQKVNNNSNDKTKKISINNQNNQKKTLINQCLVQGQKISVDSVKHEEKKGRIIKEIPIILPEHIERKRVLKKDVKIKQEQVVFKKIIERNDVIEKIIPKINQNILKNDLKNNMKNDFKINQEELIKTINLDHDYCLINQQNQQKNNLNHQNINNKLINQRSILRNQPTIKMADGKLMVSLLKVNTIKNNNINKTLDTTKKKLNLEEYKKRRQNRFENNLNDKRLTLKNSENQFWGLDPYPKLPKNLEMKTFVSIGINTDQTWAKVQEITKRNSFNFSPNSLIASMVENHLPQSKNELKQNQPEIGENKTIVYLDKNRPKNETCNKRVQTDIIRRRSRLSSSSSSSNSSISSTTSTTSTTSRTIRKSRAQTRTLRTSSRSSSKSSSKSSSRSSSRSVSPNNSRKRRRTSSERIREIEERRVIYVGRIANGTTQEDLRRRFFKFGPINYVSVHFRRTGDNYGFVTFRYKEDAYEAVEHGNDDVSLPRYDLSFGGRRVFCKTSYADLDNMRDDYVDYHPRNDDECGLGTFEDLLRDFQAKVRSKKIRSS